MEIRVKKIDVKAKLPSYALEHDAGLDLFSLDEVTIPAGQVKNNIRTGIAIAIPDGYVGLCWDKSGLAANHGLKTMAGVIDSGYRGELLLTLYNSSDKDYNFKAGDKIMQLLIQPVARVEVVETNELSPSQRADGGFGSTGE